MALKLDHPDVFLALSQAVPKTTVKTLGFVYDVAFEKFPKSYRDAKTLSQNTADLVAASTAVIATSAAGKMDISTSYPDASGKITVIYPGVSFEFTPEGPKYVGAVPYFLYVGHLKPLKNIPRIIEAFAKLLSSYPQKYTLVLIGSIVDIDPEIHKTIAKLKLSKQVDIKGILPDAELPKYYRGALGFVSPALYEGFGLPILEAMACGCPVIAGNNSSMIETVGKSGLLADAQDSTQIYQAMYQLATDPTVRRKYSKLGIKQAKLFSTQSFAKKTLQLIYEICKK